MKKILFLVFLIGVAWTGIRAAKLRVVNNQSFQAGENYVYKVKYGILTIGQANVDVHDNITTVNGRPCYRVNVEGRTAGMASIWRVKNTYRSFIDTTAIIPHRFVYSARENNYAKDQVFDFDHNRNLVKRTEKENITEYKVPEYVQDVISGYYYLRTIDFSKMRIGEQVNAPMFFDDELYNMRVKYAGKAVVKTKFGRINVLKLNPVLPQNKLFKGEEAIRIFVSDDTNRVPIRLEIDFSFGTIAMEMTGYQEVRKPFRWI
jgi:hypothetical protein